MKLKQILSAAGAALILSSPSTSFALKQNINIADLTTAARSIGTIHNIEYYDYNNNYKIDISDLVSMSRMLQANNLIKPGIQHVNIVEALNFYREEVGLPSLSPSVDLEAVAAERAQEQADNNWIKEKIYKNGIKEFTLFNVYSSFEDDALKIAIREFYTHLTSKEMILNPINNYAAVGIAQAGDGTWIITLLTQEK